MGASTSFLSSTSPENGEPSETRSTHRTKEQRIQDLESEPRVKLDKIRCRIRELERQKYVLMLSMKRIQYRLGERITRINNEHNEHDLELITVQSSVQLDDTEVGTTVTQILKTEEIVPEEYLQMVQCKTSDMIQSETLVTEDRVGQIQRPETTVMDTSDPDNATDTNEPILTEWEQSLLCISPEINRIQSETLVIEDKVKQAQRPETSVMDTSDPDTATDTNESIKTEQEQSLLSISSEIDRILSEIFVTEDRMEQTQRPETSVMDISDPNTATDTNEPILTEWEQSLLCISPEIDRIQSETLVTEDGVGKTQRPEIPVMDTSDPDTATDTNEPFMTEREQSLLNQLLQSKLSYLQSCDNGIDVNTGLPVMKSKPHICMSALEKSLLNELGTMCLFDLWYEKGLEIKDNLRQNKSDIQPPASPDAELGIETAPQADVSTTNSLPEAYKLETTQLSNESTLKQHLTNNATCLCNSSDSFSTQVPSTQRVTYCIRYMLASCSQPIAETHRQKTIEDKFPTNHHLSKRLEQRRIEQTKKSTTRKQIKSKSHVKSGYTAEDEGHKNLHYAYSYDSSFWRQIQCQPAIGENAGKENEVTQKPPNPVASCRNASIGEDKTSRKKPEIHIQSNKTNSPVPSVPLKVVTNNNIEKETNNDLSADTQATVSRSQQSKSSKRTEKLHSNRVISYEDKTRSKQASVAGLNADEALKIAVEAIRRCPRVTSSVYRLEHLTNTLESQIVYLEALSTFNMYLKAPVIMREVCAKLSPYFLWDWCKYASKIQARRNYDIHRQMLNFLKKKVYCSSLYLRPYYEDSISDN